MEKVMKEVKDYYSILGIECPSNDAEIKKAYRLKALKWHPDINKSPEASNMMRLLIEAHFVLSKPETKVIYDKKYAQIFGEKPKYKDMQFDSDPRVHPPTINQDVEIDEIFIKAKKYADSKIKELKKELREDITKASDGIIDTLFKIFFK